MAPHQAGVGEVLGRCPEGTTAPWAHQHCTKATTITSPWKRLGHRTQTNSRLLLMRSALWVYTVATSGDATYSVPNNYNLEVQYGFGVWFCFFFPARKLHFLF